MKQGRENVSRLGGHYLQWQPIRFSKRTSETGSWTVGELTGSAYRCPGP